MQSFDLVVSGGQVVIPGAGIFRLDVGIRGGKVAALAPDLAGDGVDVLNARGKFVFPGIVDPHIHLGIFGPLEVEAETETRSALLGGVTTVGAFMGGPASYLETLGDVLETVERKSLVDFFFHLPLNNELQKSEVAAYAERFGITSFKLYMCGIPGLIPSQEDDFLYDAFRAVARLGGVACVHAENYRLVDLATAEVRARGGSTLADWAETHPNAAEAEAVVRGTFLAAEAGCPIYLVHVSTKESVAALRGVKKRGTVYAETTSPYLAIDRDNSKGVLLKMAPPFREQESVEALWQGVREGVLDTIGTDNVTMTKAVKQAEKGIWEAMPGYAALATHLPSVLEEGYHKRGVDLLRLVEMMTMNPARIFGLYPQKGTLLPGSDADLAVVDPAKAVTVRQQDLLSNSDFSIFEGETLRGWPVATVKGGRVVMRDGLVTRESGQGRYLRRR